MNGIKIINFCGIDDEFLFENDKKLDELLTNYSTMPIPELDEYANVELPHFD